MENMPCETFGLSQFVVFAIVMRGNYYIRESCLHAFTLASHHTFDPV